MFKKIIKKTLKIIYRRIAIKKISSYKGIPYINSYCSFNNNCYLGINCHFNGISIRGQGKVVIGNNFHSGTDLLIITDVHDYNGTMLPYDANKIIKNVFIEDNVWVGTRVTILGGITIGEGAIIQAGSVVSKSVAALEIVGGNPANPFKYRDKKHYFDLKDKSLFF